MNKTVKRILALMLAMLMLVSALAACGNDSGNSSSESSQSEASTEDSSSEESSDVGDETEPENTGWTIPSIDSEDYDEISDYYYDFNLKEFHELCDAYAAEIDDQNKRWT